MSLNLAARVNRIKPSPTLAVNAKAKALQAEGRDVISLGVGEPDFNTPAHIIAAAKKAMDEGLTRYTAVPGILPLREAIIAKLKNDNQLSYQSSEILVSCGAKHSLYNVMAALLDAGDEVVIPAPYWVSYPDMALVCHGTPVFVHSDITAGYKITAQQLDAAITAKTKLVILNSPSNPTGVAYSKEELQALGDVLRQHPEIAIISDDIYEHIYFAATPFANILNACPDLQDRTIIINGVSKAYAMTGWRIGYAAAPEMLIKAMTKIQSQSTSNACSIAQAAAAEAIGGKQDCLGEMRDVFKQRHDKVLARLQQMPGVNAKAADGAFYLFPDVSDAIKSKGLANDVAFAEGLLTEHGVALVPGSAFGSEGCIRISYALGDEEMTKALDRLASFVA